MKLVTMEQWDNAPKENKKIYDGTPYMIYKEEDSICFGPVKVLEDNIKKVEDRHIIYYSVIKYHRNHSSS